MNITKISEYNTIPVVGNVAKEMAYCQESTPEKKVLSAEEFVVNLSKKDFYKENIYKTICHLNVAETRKQKIIEVFQKKAMELGGLKFQELFDRKLENCYSMLEKEKQCLDEKVDVLSGFVDGMTNYSSLPEGVINLPCGERWLATDEGIFSLTSKGKKPNRVSRQPLLITGILQSADTREEQVRLLYKQDGIWKECVCEKTVIASAAKIVSLSSRGVSITSQNAKDIVAFLQDMEDCSRLKHMVPLVKTIASMGWNKEKTVFYPFTEEPFQYEDRLGVHGLEKTLREKGDRNAWYERFKQVRRIPMVRFLAAASLASPLVGLLDVEGFTSCLYGESRGGKSVANKIVSSLWAGHLPEDGFLFSANNTINSLDAILGARRNVPFVMEDLNNMPEADQKRLPQELAMKIGNGVGKGRMTKNGTLKEVGKWNMTACVTAEKRMTSNFHNAGAYNRVVQMEGTSQEDCPFTKDGMDVGELLDFFENNHGFGGRDFVKTLQKIGKEKLSQRLYEIRQKVSAEVRKKGKAGGQVLPVAIMLLADAIAEEQLFHDGVRCDIAEAMEWMADENTVDQHARFYDTLMDLLRTNSAKIEDWRLIEYSSNAYWGRYIEEKGHIGILPKILKELAEEHAVDCQLFLKYLDKKGLLIKDKDGNLTRNVYSKLLERGTRMYVIALPKEEKKQTENVEEYTQLEIPF